MAGYAPADAFLIHPCEGTPESKVRHSLLDLALDKAVSKAVDCNLSKLVLAATTKQKITKASQ